MKIILLNLLLISSIFCYSQHTEPKKGEKWIRAGLFTSSIVFDAISDGLYDENKKLISKSFKAASIGTLLSVPLFTTINKKRKLEYVLEFSLMRYAMFDDVYNITVGNGPFSSYGGTTSIQDQIKSKIPTPIIVISKFTSFGFALHINNNIHHDPKKNKKIGI